MILTYGKVIEMKKRVMSILLVLLIVGISTIAWAEMRCGYNAYCAEMVPCKGIVFDLNDKQPTGCDDDGGQCSGLCQICTGKTEMDICRVTNEDRDCVESTAGEIICGRTLGYPCKGVYQDGCVCDTTEEPQTINFLCKQQVCVPD
jgi:hypothetical protein